ncbi:unnamed protein product, partial [marine sediment metagenome]
WEIGDENTPGETSLYLYQIKEKESGTLKISGTATYEQEWEGDV